MNNEELEEFKDWIEYARTLELTLALDHIKHGKPVEEIIKQFSSRLTEKMLFPLTQYIKLSELTNYNSEQGLQEYKEYFELKNIRPKSDHVQDENYK